jgi:uncharacterized protein
MERDLQTILQRDNPWLADPAKLESWLVGHVPAQYIPRDAARQAGSRWADPKRAHLVVGPRQAGKSTLLWAWLAKRGRPALFVDCEQRLVREWCRSAPLFLEGLSTVVVEPPVLFFDEVQHLDDAGLFVKGLVDRHYAAPILVTGSSSFHLGARTRESLAGRVTRTRLLPFSLQEVSQEAEDRPPALRDRHRSERFERHVAVGGYPEVWLSDDPAPLLHDLVEAFVLRDASDRFRIERPDAFRQLLGLLARQAGSLVNYSEWAAILGISRDAVASYLAILEEGHVVATIRPFVGGGRAELTSRPKVFLVDNGIRSHLVGDLRSADQRADRGPMLENWVFSELLKVLGPDRPLRFWRSTSQAEVDFVAEAGGRLAAVEVKATALGQPRLPRAARSFVEAYRPEILFLVNTSLEHDEMLSTTRLVWTTPWKVAEELGDWVEAAHPA